MKIIAIVQARMGSSRLPGKVLMDVNGKSIIEVLLSRLSNSKLISKIVVATTSNFEDNDLASNINKLGFNCFRGSENNVLERFYFAAKEHKADIVIRITGDCPFIDPEIVDNVVEGYLKSGVDYYSNVMPPTYPDGLDVEVFSFDALQKSYTECIEPYQLEHVTPFMRESDFFKRDAIMYKTDYSRIRLTLDENEDFELIKKIFDYFHPNINFTFEDILKLRIDKPVIFNLNDHIKRNEGALMGKGQKLYKRAKAIIPGGNMLLSKRPEMFLPDHWPSYFSKASGCLLWDLDGNKFIDMSIMGIGTNILGYGNPEVDEAVLNTVKMGNMSSLNCPEEVYLAEKLIELHPWADMARFARSGGEANSVAIRIARAFSGKDKVAICGYHGWHDWYLSANLSNDKSLDGHLLPGLNPNGVPRNLKGTVFPFTYNNFDELEALVDLHDIGVIKMEVQRNEGPEDDFLHKVRQLATKRSIVLIFDECTSGFRETLGGIHSKYSVEPDMAMFGKALGNGYAITSVIGRKEIMNAAQSSFISSTFWTERIGPTAALKTLEVMAREKSWNNITKTGRTIKRKWEDLGSKYNLTLDQWGIPALAGFTIKSPNALKYKTLITQEMLSKGYLASNSVYVCTKHDENIIGGYFEALDPIFALISDCENGRNIDDLLNGPVCHTGFSRLN